MLLQPMCAVVHTQPHICRTTSVILRGGENRHLGGSGEALVSNIVLLIMHELII